MNRQFLLSTLLAALILGLLPGCAGYRLGSMLPDDIKSVYVPTFINQSKEPLLETETTRATIEEFQKDGSLTVAPPESADAELEVTLMEYALTPIAYRRDQKSTTQEYRMTIYASVILKRRSDGSVISKNPRVKGETTFDMIGDLSSSKLRVLPQAAADLAHNIVERVVESWQ